MGVMDTLSEIYPVFMNLIDAIQEGSQVWINLWYPEDTVVLKDFMQRKGMPLTDYKFIISKENTK